MKKLMFAVAAVAAGVAFAEVQSANIVGYQNLGTDSAESPSVGMTFTPISGAETFKLGTITAKDMDPDIDCLQLLDSETTKILGQYSYFSKELADELAIDDGGQAGDYDDLVGWWDIGMAGEPDNYRGDEDINVGQGFLGLMMSHSPTFFVANGEVPTEWSFIHTDNAESPYICNYMPINFKFKDITATDMDPDIDCLQLLDSETTKILGQYSYFSKELADELAIDDGGQAGDYDDLVGWWDVGMAGEPDNYRGEEPLNAGQAFLGLMMSHGDTYFNFPGVNNLKK